MFANTLALGVSATLLSFDKRSEAAGQSQFSVAGTTALDAKTLDIKHEVQKSGRRRSQFKLLEVSPVTGTTTGQTEVTEVYIVVNRAPGKSAADVKAMFARLKTFVDSTALQDQFLNLEN